MPFSLSLPQPRAVAAPWYLLAQRSPDTTTKNRKEAFMRKPELAAAIADKADLTKDPDRASNAARGHQELLSQPSTEATPAAQG